MQPLPEALRCFEPLPSIRLGALLLYPNGHYPGTNREFVPLLEVREDGLPVP